MKNSEMANSIKYAIQDRKKFIEKLKSLFEDIEGDIIENISNELFFSSSTVSRWMTEQSTPNSENIEYILKNYNLKPEDIGAIEVDIQQEKKIEEEKKKIFSQRLKGLLEDSNMKQKELSKKLKIPCSSISEWCKGKSRPKYATMEKIANQFRSFSILFNWRY